MRLTSLRTMRLLTHNMLTSHVKGVTNGYPLIIESTEIRENKVDFNPEFIQRMVPRIEWSALVKAMEMIGKSAAELPQEVPKDFENDNDFLEKVHNAIMEVEVISGNLKCPESGRAFPIQNGVPNMLLNEDEV